MSQSQAMQLARLLVNRVIRHYGNSESFRAQSFKQSDCTVYHTPGRNVGRSVEGFRLLNRSK